MLDKPAFHSREANVTLQQLLLSVPFYVYEELAWLNATWKGKAIVEHADFKHSDDYWIMVNALRHPMRTKNPAEAKLFVIPSLHNFFDDRADARSSDLCVGTLCNDELMLSAAKVVTSSPYFQSHPEAHLADVSHWAHRWSNHYWWTGKPPDLYFHMLNRSSNIHFETFKTNSGWSVPTMLVGKACPLQANKTHDVALVATFKPDDPRFRHRETICQWLANHSFFKVERCGSGAMCPALGNARLGFHVRGDTPGANRLIDNILSGTIPVFTMKEQYEVVPKWINWERISYFMDLEVLNETQFIKDLRAILKDTSTYNKKMEILMANRHLFDWTTLFPFDTYMYMLQTYLYPETRHNAATIFAAESIRSVLILP